MKRKLEMADMNEPPPKRPCLTGEFDFGGQENNSPMVTSIGKPDLGVVDQKNHPIGPPPCQKINFVPQTIPDLHRDIFYNCVKGEAEEDDMNTFIRTWEYDLEKEDVVFTRRQSTWPDRHEGITARHRGIVLDWMAEISHEQNISRRAYQIAVTYVDMFMSQTNGLDLEQLQLVALAMLIVAVKIEDQFPLSLRDVCRFAGRDLPDNEVESAISAAVDFVTDCEAQFLEIMNWDVILPTPYDFLGRAIQLTKLIEGGKFPDLGERDIVQSCYELEECEGPFRLLQASLTHHKSMRFRISELAAAIYYLAWPFENYGKRDQLTSIVTNYHPKSLQHCITFITTHVAPSLTKDVLRDVSDEVLRRSLPCRALKIQTLNDFEIEPVLDIMYPDLE
ncbi:cyclin-like protein [Phlyctochytrium arcticum]|nr:cyclin-like protein [Phlyctochytrium arcticum]